MLTIIILFQIIFIPNSKYDYVKKYTDYCIFKIIFRKSSCFTNFLLNNINKIFLIIPQSYTLLSQCTVGNHCWLFRIISFFLIGFTKLLWSEKIQKWILLRLLWTSFVTAQIMLVTLQVKCPIYRNSSWKILSITSICLEGIPNAWILTTNNEIQVIILHQIMMAYFYVSFFYLKSFILKDYHQEIYDLNFSAHQQLYVINSWLERNSFIYDFSMTIIILYEKAFLEEDLWTEPKRGILVESILC